MWRAGAQNRKEPRLRAPIAMSRSGEGARGLDLEQIGAILVRVSLAVTLIWVGALKFSTYEAEGIKPLVANSPLLSWAYTVLSVSTFAAILGTGEIIIGIMILTRPIAPMISAIGSLGAAILFFVTVTFILTTPGVFQADLGVPFLSPMPGQFLAKDIALFSISIWTAGEAFRAARGVRPGSER